MITDLPPGEDTTSGVPKRTVTVLRCGRGGPPGGSRVLVPLIPAGTSGAPAAAARRAAPRWKSPVWPSRDRVPSGKTITSCPAASSRTAAARSVLPPPERRTGNAAHSARQIAGRSPPRNQ